MYLGSTPSVYDVPMYRTLVMYMVKPDVPLRPSQYPSSMPTTNCLLCLLEVLVSLDAETSIGLKENTTEKSVSPGIPTYLTSISPCIIAHSLLPSSIVLRRRHQDDRVWCRSLLKVIHITVVPHWTLPHWTLYML